MKVLKPILIQYSSPSHRQGLRKYFQGEYRIDYGNYSQQKEIETKRSNKGFLLHHNRCKTQNCHDSVRYNNSQRYSKDEKCYDCSNRYLGSKQKYFQGVNPETRLLDLNSQSIQLPKISKLKTQQSQPNTIIKKNHYICGDFNCPTKSHKSLILPIKKQKKNKSKIKPRQLKIPVIPDVRKRYTPTFVCSRDNPLPCFKIYESSA